MLNGSSGQFGLEIILLYTGTFCSVGFLDPSLERFFFLLLLGRVKKNSSLERISQNLQFNAVNYITKREAMKSVVL